MNLHDHFESSTKPPRMGTLVRFDYNARNAAFRGAHAEIVACHVIHRSNFGEYTKVNAGSVDSHPPE